MRILGQGLIFDAHAAPPNRRVCHHTSVFRDHSGRMLATFRRGSGKDADDGNCAVAATADPARGWEILSEGFDPMQDGVVGEIRNTELCEPEPGLLLAFQTWIDRSSGKGLYDGTSDTLLPCRIRVSGSEDGGRTWLGSGVLDLGDMTGTTLTGPTVHIPGKGWLVPFENHQVEEEGGQGVHGAYALFSPDGVAFDQVIRVARHPGGRLFYWDQRLAYSPAHRQLVGMFWTYDRLAQKDQLIHLAWGHAEALKWEAPFSTGIRGQIASPIPLPDGRLLAFYVHRHPPGSMRLVVSGDAGRNWDHDGELVVYEKPGREAGADGKSSFAQYWDDMHAWTFGHPAGALMNDGSVLLVYYAGDDATCLTPRWARVEVES